MTTAELITKYGITGFYDQVSMNSINLFSGNMNDVSMAVEVMRENGMWGKWVDIVYAIGSPIGYIIDDEHDRENQVIAQVISFKSEEDYQRYLADGILVFKNKNV